MKTQLLRGLFAIERKRDAKDRIAALNRMISCLRAESYKFAARKNFGMAQVLDSIADKHARRARRIRKVIYGE
jgi:hypothetical protein